MQHINTRRQITPTDFFQVFKDDDTQIVSDILSAAKGNVIELVAILQSLLLKNPDVSRLKAALNTASIDLFDIVHSLKSLNQYHPRKYPIDEAQLQKLEADLGTPLGFF
jgi:cob(I)alamin adenosyltransferase